MKRLGWVGTIAFLLAILLLVVRRRSADVDLAVRAGASRAPAPPAKSDREPGADLDTATRDADRATNGARSAVSEITGPIRIGGVVIDYSPDAKQSGVVAQGIEVQLGEGFFGEKVSAPLRTGDDGRFTFDFTVGAEGSPHLRQATAKVTLAQGQREALDLVLRRYPMGDLVGTTVDTKGRPVPGVHLTVRFSHAFRETDSDAEGRFRIPDAEWIGELEATRTGYALLRAVKPNQLKESGWEPMRVVLAPTVRLVVRAVDGRGEGVAGVRVAANVSEWERNGPKRFDNTRTFRSAPGAVTGADGRATLESVWTEQRLSLVLDASDTEDGRSPRTFERELDGRLVRAPSADGRPILLAREESRELTAIFETSPVVRGVVVDELSQPVSGAYVRLEGYQGIAPYEHLQELSKCDAEGRFSFEVPYPAPVSTRVTATDRFPFGATGVGVRVASLSVDFVSTPRSDLVLMLHSGRRLAGRVIGTDGKGVRGLVYAFAAHDPPDDHGWGGTSLTEKDGSFSIEGVEPGLYDLLAQPNDPYGEVRVPAVEAGSEDLEITVPARRAAHITVEVLVQGGEASQVILLNARPRFPPNDVSGVPALPLEGEYQEPGNWPRAVVGMHYGAGGFEDERGAWMYNLTPAKHSPEELDVDPSVHWLGAKGTDSEGRPLFPVGTGLLRIEAGEYRLRFEMAPAVSVEGRLVGPDVLDLEVGIARCGGRLFELDVGSGDLRTARPVGADGAFSFAAVPVGENEVWIGTADELAAGKPARRQPLIVEAKGVPFLEIAVR